jgi:coproporphyrinogen III oxidase-like Fe-S oxidoreductase
LYREKFRKDFDEDRATDMYLLGHEMLRHAGFIRYEVSSFYRNQGSSLHNLLAWNGHDYLGKQSDYK